MSDSTGNSSSNPKKPTSPDRDEVVYLSFGRYRGGTQADGDSLVGREAERASFIDALRSRAAPDAYLITGLRGSGKTSFVRGCISEYHQDVYARFLKSGVGRSYADLVVMCGMLLTAVAGLLFISELFSVLVWKVFEKIKAGNWPGAFVIALPALPLLFVCMMPILAGIRAASLARKALYSAKGANEDSSGAMIFAIVAFVLTIAVLVMFSPLLNASSMAAALVFFSGLFRFVWLNVVRLGASDQKWPYIVGCFSLSVALLVFYHLNLHSPNHDEHATLPLLFVGAWLGLLPPTSHFQAILVLIGGVTPFALRAILIFIYSENLNIVQYYLYLVIIDLVIMALMLIVPKRFRDKNLKPGPNLDTAGRRRLVGVLYFVKALSLIFFGLNLVEQVFRILLIWLLPNVGRLKNFYERIANWLDAKSEFLKNTSQILSEGNFRWVWLLAFVVLFVIIYELENSSIVQGFRNEQLDKSLKNVPDSINASAPNSAMANPVDALEAREYIQGTFAWSVWRGWLPVIEIQINLGYEDLPFKGVLHAMMSEFRHQFHRKVLAWNSPLAIAGMSLKVTVVLWATSLLHPVLISISPENGMSPDIILALNTPLVPIEKLTLLASHKAAPLNASKDDLCELEKIHGKSSCLFEHSLWDPPVPILLSALREADPKKPYSIRFSHLVSFALSWTVVTWLVRRYPLIPYREQLNQMDQILDRLTAKTKKESRFKLAASGHLSSEEVSSREVDPADPRYIEQALIRILGEIQTPTINLPGGSKFRIHLPSPELIFIFDELDKLGTRGDPEDGLVAGTSGRAADFSTARGTRLRKMHSLLADMKNMISTCKARFIFVGGRELHDEWLADQTARQPLLTSIFSAEIYLPSLISNVGSENRGGKANSDWTYFPKQYLLRQFELAKRRAERTSEDIMAATLQLTPGSAALVRFDQAHHSGESLQWSYKDHLDLDHKPNWLLNQTFVQFITYRSLGNPKRLKELLESFILPDRRPANPNSSNKGGHNVEQGHAIILSESKRFRIELLADVYRHLERKFLHRFHERDDKVSTMLFFLSDFLFRFHRRSFSWSNLERVEDLVHAHRAPDTREIIDELVNHWSERFLHGILNGMYDFRFRSDMAREIEYISRLSPDEMAAFNFTLDESQALKMQYQAAIDAMGDNVTTDLLGGLGNIYEFDQDYDTARYFYRRAIRQGDEGEGFNGGGPEERTSTFSWRLTRLRLMLEIGMTYELAGDLKGALPEYSAARASARKIITDLSQREADKTVPELNLAKHLDIIFQPTFAEAWIAEKLHGGVDTSLTVVEEDLAFFHTVLPWVSEAASVESVIEARREQRSTHSNIGVLVGELHNKAGDLYFFKGCQAPVGTDSESSGDGYLLRAHEHYALALHEMRRFLTARKKRSKSRLGLSVTPPNSQETINQGGWPDFAFRAVGGTIIDMAEAALARVDLSKVSSTRTGCHTESITEFANEAQTLEKTFGNWLDSTERDQSSIETWVGTWPNGTELSKHDRHSSSWRIVFEKKDSDDKRLRFALLASWAGASLIKNGGYSEDAAREYLQVAQLAVEILRCMAFLRGTNGMPKTPEPLSLFLVQAARRCLMDAKRIFEETRPSKSGYAVGDSYPVELPATMAAFLMTVKQTIPASFHSNASVHEIEEALKGSIATKESLSGEETLKNTLENLIRFHTYPMASRIYCLSAIVDAHSFGNNMSNSNKLLDDLERLISWADLYNSPLHFTPSELGIVLGRCYLSRFRTTPYGLDETAQKRAESIRSRALASLRRAQEMYTMKRAYYDSIRGLYYLYDDHNDRKLHHKHALQMLVRSQTQKIIDELDKAPPRQQTSGNAPHR